MGEQLNYSILPEEIWQHYKGGNYEIVTLAVDTETDERVVVYQSISFGSVHVRPLAIWEEMVVNDAGEEVPRFRKMRGSPEFTFL